MEEMEQIRAEIVRLKEVSLHSRLLVLRTRSHHRSPTRFVAINSLIKDSWSS
jgi:hypothetical protein